MNYDKADRAAPDTPACFPGRKVWVSYLIDCQASGRGISTRPFEHGKYRPDFSFCVDCTASHATAMAIANKCHPSQFREPAVEIEA